VPELPEVETMVRGIRPFVEGREITAVRTCRCACKPISITPRLGQLRKRIQGQIVANVSRLAKRIVIELSSGEALVIEPRMTGLMLLGDPPDREHLRLQWQFSGNADYNSLWFWDRRGLGTVRLYTQKELADDLGPQKLGADALEMTERNWHDRCARTSRAIKVALLDQKLVAGIGNLYASEILHQARIHPALPANELKPRHIRKLHASVQAILSEAIRLEGSTLSDATYRNALNQNGRYQNHHRVYQRNGETCDDCSKAPIQRIVQSQRSTFFCPECQKPGPGRQKAEIPSIKIM